MPYRSWWIRCSAGFALASAVALPASAQDPDASGELWEQQIREEVRRDILERETRLWESRDVLDTLEPRVSNEFTTEDLIDAEIGAADPTDSAPTPRAATQTRLPFAPVPSRADLAAANAPHDPSSAIAPNAALEFERALGLDGLDGPEGPDGPAPPTAAAPGDLTRAATPGNPAPHSSQATVPVPPVGPPVATPIDEAIDFAEKHLDPQLFAGSEILIGAIALALLAVALVARRRGDLTVQIVYPQELRGSFRVSLDHRRKRYQHRQPGSDQDILKGASAGGNEHQLVARETSFQRLICRRYYVTVDGVLQDPRDGSAVAHPFIQGSATVLHRRTVRLDVDATPGACPVDVKILWDEREVADALVAARGHPGGSVETVRGRVRLHLPRGEYLIVAGGGDRVVETPLQVRSHLPTELVIDLGSNDGTVFKACPPAIEPYLSGQIEVAAEQLTRDGQPQQAHRLLGRRCREHGRDSEAALHFEAANDLLQAAEIQSELGNYAHAGELFERSHDLLSAAEMYQLSGQEVRAGRAYEASRDFDNAIACYRSAGDVTSWVEALDRRGDIFDAARTALENGLPTRGIRLLHRVPQEDEHYRDACVLLADAFEREQHYDLAARKLTDYIDAGNTDEVEPKLYARLAELHEKAGDLESALDVLEALRLVDPSFPNLATRAEQLRKARSARRQLDAHLLPDDAALAPTVVLANQRYEQLEEIGRGGMGVVFKARDRRLGRIVALKRLSENLREHPRAVEQFLREARAAAALNHPNIVTVYDADLEDGMLFITMELLDGHPLHQLLRQRGRLSTREIARIGSQVCAGLEYAHARGVIHRDIKTANLFQTTEGRTKIMDFGLAKLTAEVRGGASLIGGTPYYMAPEQTLGAAVDHRADLYSLGATLFELATGRVPFPDGDAQHHSRHSPPPDPREVEPDVDPRLAALLLELLEKDPAQRPQSAAEAGLRLSALESTTAAEL